MSQHDMNLANDSGANLRTDLNNALSALVQNSSGATTPSTTFAHQFWADTSPSGYTQFKIRNAANAAWATCFDDEGRWKGIDGSASEPSMSFGSDVDTGFYRIGSGHIGLALNGVNAMKFSAGGMTMQGHLNIEDASPLINIKETDAGVDEKEWQFQPSTVDNTFFDFNAANDGASLLQPFMRFKRSAGTPQYIEFSTTVRHLPVTITTDTTPTAVGRNFIIIGAWTAANDITDFDNEIAGQRLTILGGDSDCNVVDGAPIQLVGGTTWSGVAGATLELISDGTVWYELSRSDAS